MAKVTPKATVLALDPLLAKEVAAPGGPAAAQVRHTADCPVNDRESPCVTLLTGTWRARRGSLGVEDQGRARGYSSKIAPRRAPWPAWSTCASRRGIQKHSSRVGGC